MIAEPAHSVDPFQRLVLELSKLPGVGEKTATRLAYHLLRQDKAQVDSLVRALSEAKTKIGYCSTCFTFSDTDPCRICSNPLRDRTTLCVVERPVDAITLEKTGAHRGLYHVLHGAISPLDGIGPEQLRVRELLERIRSAEPSVQEVVFATNPSVEGEATSLYLSRLLKPIGIRLTRLAHGIPVGGMLEYTDRETLSRAMTHRVELN